MRSPLGMRVAQANEKLEWSEHEINSFPGIQDNGRDYVIPGERVLYELQPWLAIS